jgi:hypothetical protein
VAEDVQAYCTITATCAICPPEGQRTVRIYSRYYDITDLAMRPHSPPSHLSLVIVIEVFLWRPKYSPHNTKSLTTISQYLVPRTGLTVMACLSSARSSVVSWTLLAAQFSRVRLAFLFIKTEEQSVRDECSSSAQWGLTSYPGWVRPWALTMPPTQYTAGLR